MLVIKLIMHHFVMGLSVCDCSNFAFAKTRGHCILPSQMVDVVFFHENAWFYAKNCLVIVGKRSTFASFIRRKQSDCKAPLISSQNARGACGDLVPKRTSIAWRSLRQ